jgi:peptide/bleomycin uptake transporter
MFRSFFLSRRWLKWSLFGTLFIVGVTYFRVQLDVRINEWFGGFYDTIQKALATPGAVTFEQILGYLWTFAGIAGIAVVTAVILEFFLRHYVFRWRTAMNDYYTSHWPEVRHIEGASQRIQEDTMRFRAHHGNPRHRTAAVGDDSVRVPADALGDVGPGVGTAVAGRHSAFARVGGPGVVAFRYRPTCRRRIKLPGLEFNNQKVEAAYRKELVFGEEYEDRAQPPTLSALYRHCRATTSRSTSTTFTSTVAKWSYLQFGVLIPYIAMGPTIAAGAITLGVMQQIMRAVRPGGGFLPVPGQQLGHDRGAAEHLQAVECVRDAVEAGDLGGGGSGEGGTAVEGDRPPAGPAGVLAPGLGPDLAGAPTPGLEGGLRGGA